MLSARIIQQEHSETAQLQENFANYKAMVEQKIRFLETQLKDALQKAGQYDTLCYELRIAKEEKEKAEKERALTQSLAKDMVCANEKLVKSLKRSRTHLAKYSGGGYGTTRNQDTLKTVSAAGDEFYYKPLLL